MTKRNKPMRPCSQFHYWPNSNESVEVIPPPPPEGSTPWFVVIRGEGHIPISLLVFALTGEAAVERVLWCMRECRDKQYASPYGNRTADHLAKYEAGEYWHEVSPLDTTCIVAHVNWASNGGVS